MTVRELIIRLMDLDMDATVDIMIPIEAMEKFQEDKESVDPPYYADILRIYDRGTISITNIR